MPPGAGILVFFLGALWGSFFYTLALRYAGGYFTRDAWRALLTRSRCPRCGSAVSPAGLVPVLGYLLLRGRCRNCGEKISPAYPLFEVLYGLLLLLIAQRLGLTVYAGAVFLIAGISISLSVIDVKTLTLPGPLILAVLLISLYPVIMNWDPVNNLFGLLLMGGFFLVMLFLFPGSFGGGDVKFAAVIGWLTGWELAIVTLEVALVTGSLAGILYAVKTKKGLRIRFPFAPFLTAGMIAALLYGRDILLLYYRWVF